MCVLGKQYKNHRTEPINTCFVLCSHISFFQINYLYLWALTRRKRVASESYLYFFSLCTNKYNMYLPTRIYRHICNYNNSEPTRMCVKDVCLGGCYAATGSTYDILYIPLWMMKKEKFIYNPPEKKYLHVQNIFFFTQIYSTVSGTLQTNWVWWAVVYTKLESEHFAGALFQCNKCEYKKKIFTLFLVFLRRIDAIHLGKTKWNHYIYIVLMERNYKQWVHSKYLFANWS